MSVSATAILDITYYFGIISIDNSTNDKIEVTWQYADDDTIKGITDVNVKTTNWMTSSQSCPFAFNTNIALSNDVQLNKETVIIVPEQFYNPSTYTYSDNTNSGKLYYGSSPFPYSPKLYKRIVLGNTGHYCISLQDKLNGGGTVIIK